MTFPTVVTTATATISQTHQGIPYSGGAGVGVSVGVGVGVGVGAGAGVGIDVGSGAIYFNEHMKRDWGRYPVISSQPNPTLTLASIIFPITL